MSKICIRPRKRYQRKRSENWTTDERILLKRLIKERIHVIENKKSTTTVNLLKANMWKQIWQRFLVENRRPRSLENLRVQWKLMKERDPEEKKLRNKHKDLEEALDTHLNHTECQSEDPLALNVQNVTSPETVEQNDYCDNPESPSTAKPVRTRLYYSQKGGVEYKRSLLELNKIVKEELTNCAVEEHILRMHQMKEEHNLKVKTTTELHAIECENKRLEGQLLMLDIEIRKKQLNTFVL